VSSKNQSATAVVETGNVVVRGVSVGLDSEVGQAFVLDVARHSEGLLSESDVKMKWGLTDRDWAELPSNELLLDRVRRERERRIFSGTAAREGAQQHFAKAPYVLGGILNDGTISPRHRIEAARELRQTANDQNLAKDAQEKEKFVVVINLGASEKPFRFEADVEHRDNPVIDDGQEP
jgi:hypothetical protein